MAQNTRPEASLEPQAAPSDDEEEGQDEKAELFSAVLSRLDKDHLPQLAAAVRQRSGDQHEGVPTVEEPVYGSYHLLFPLLFPDGIRWMAKFPVNGTPEKWNELSSRALDAEANTMRLLKKETTIPLPTVFDFSATADNKLGCPYILMSFIAGKPLYDVWFGHRQGSMSPETVEGCRTRALQDIASAMTQLKQFSFEKGGFLTFDSDGNPSGVGPMRRVDHQAMLDRWFVDDDASNDPIYVESPTFDHLHEYYTFALGLHEQVKPFPRGVALLLKALVDCIPPSTGTKPFVLAHPDYDIQNFIVSDEGELQGIIDWDGVAAVPRRAGSERYPGWLTRDWDPVMYGYQESMDEGGEPEEVWEDSPETLKHFRKLYRDMVATCRETWKGPVEAIPDEGITRMSLVIENLVIAADEPQSRNEILRKIVNEMEEVSEAEGELDFMDLVDDFASGSVDGDTLQALKDGMKVLLMAEDL